MGKKKEVAVLLRVLGGIANRGLRSTERHSYPRAGAGAEAGRSKRALLGGDRPKQRISEGPPRLHQREPRGCAGR